MRKHIKGMYAQGRRHNYKALDLSGVPVFGTSVERYGNSTWLTDFTKNTINKVMVMDQSVKRIRKGA